MDTNKIIDRIKTAPNLSELARASGVSRRVLQNIRAGSMPTMTTLIKVSAALPKKAGKVMKPGV
jgi:DNA-binding phage protein